MRSLRQCPTTRSTSCLNKESRGLIHYVPGSKSAVALDEPCEPLTVPRGAGDDRSQEPAPSYVTCALGDKSVHQFVEQLIHRRRPSDVRLKHRAILDARVHRGGGGIAHLTGQV